MSEVAVISPKTLIEAALPLDAINTASTWETTIDADTHPHSTSDVRRVLATVWDATVA